MSDAEHLSTFQKAENMAAVSGEVLLDTPSAVWDELSQDLSERPGEVAKVAGVSVGVGAAATGLLKVCPRVGAVAMAGLLGYQAYDYGRKALGFLSDASSASDDFSRSAMVERGKAAMGKEGALLVESTPGMIAGGYLASRMVGTPSLYEGVGNLADRFVGKPVARGTSKAADALSELYTFRGPGSMRIPESTIGTDGRVNVLDIGEQLASRHPWQGVETARTVDLLGGRISRPVAGRPAGIDLPRAESPGRLTFHTHGPDNPIGSRPSLMDIINTRDLGIISRGNQTTYFIGRQAELQNAISRGVADRFPVDMHALVLDHQSKTAMLFDSIFDQGSQKWVSPLSRSAEFGSAAQGAASSMPVPKFVDYQRARATLGALDIVNPKPQLDSIPIVAKLNPTAADLEPLMWMQTAAVPLPPPPPELSPMLRFLKPKLSDATPAVLTPASTLLASLAGLHDHHKKQ